MTEPQMPHGLKTSIRSAFAMKDVSLAIQLNRMWFAHVKEKRELAKIEAESLDNSNE